MIFAKITRHNAFFYEMLQKNPESMVEPLKAHCELLKKWKEEGKYLGGWYFPGDGRSVHIFDFKDESDMDNSFFEDPMNDTFEIELLAGVPIFEHIENALSNKLEEK